MTALEIAFIHAHKVFGAFVKVSRMSLFFSDSPKNSLFACPAGEAGFGEAEPFK